MPGVAGSIKSATTLEEGGALPFLLSSAKGFYADLTTFPGYEITPSPTLLTKKQNNVMLALVEGRHASRLFAQVQALGLRFSAFARPANQPTAAVKFGNAYPAAFNADFLRSINFTVSLYALAASEEKKPEAKRDTFTINGTPCSAESAYLSGNVLYSAATTQNGSVQDTANTVIAAISPLVAAGIDFSEISVSFDAQLPLLSFSETEAERALSLLMGQYRVQSELCLLSDGSRYVCTNDNLSLSCYARARLSHVSVMTSVTKNEGDLFIFAPRMSADGLVNFDELRNLYRFITSLVRSGKVTAVRAATRDGINEAIKQMVGEATLSDYTLPEELITNPLGAFIVESNENMSGLKIHYIK
jgi:hypothetical protein